VTKTGKLNHFIYLGLILGNLNFTGLSAAAEQPRIDVRATVDRDTVSVGDGFTVTVTVKSNERVDFADPRVPDIDGFALANQHSSNSVRTMFINGKVSHEVNKGFNYEFVAQKTGTLSIGSFEVVIDGKVFRTEPILMKVSAEGESTRQRPNLQNPRRPQFPIEEEDESMDPLQRMEEEMFNQLLRQRGLTLPGGGRGQQPPSNPNHPGQEPQLRTLPTNPNEAFFIQVEVDKTEVFESEQITVSWYLYTRGQMESLDRVKFPDLKGFWKEIIEEIPQLQFYEEIVNGVVYRKALLASHALFPIKAGTAIIDEYKIKSKVRLPTQSFGFGFGLGKSYEYTRTSKKTEIKVKPLPLDGRPSNFTGAVGKFEIRAKTEAQNFLVNQPFSLKIRFEGAGNAKLIELPAIQWPAGIEIYDTKSEAKFFKNGTSYKEFEILLIPRQTGSIEIPRIEFSMFDPQSKKYETKATESLKIQVGENPNDPKAYSEKTAPPSLKTSANKGELPDIIKIADFSEGNQLAKTPFLWIGLFGTVFGILLMKAQNEFGWGRRKKSLKEQLEPRFQKIDKALSKKLFREVGAETLNAYYFVLGSLAGEGGGSQEIQKLLNLIPSSLRRTYASQISESFEKFQTLTFAPEESLQNLKSPENLQKIVREAKSLIMKLVNEASSQSSEST
jgi:hypothetical protein